MEININDVNDALKNLTYFGSKVAALETVEADMKRGLRDLGSRDEHTTFLVEQGMEQIQLAKIYLTHIDKLLSGTINEYFFQNELDAAIEGHYQAVAQSAAHEQKRAAMKELDDILERFDSDEFDEDEFEEEEDDEYMEYDEDDFEDDTEEEFDEERPLLTAEDLDELNTLLDGLNLDDIDEVMKELGE